MADSRRVVGAFVTFKEEVGKLACLRAQPHNRMRQWWALKPEHKLRRRYDLPVVLHVLSAQCSQLWYPTRPMPSCALFVQNPFGHLLHGHSGCGASHSCNIACSMYAGQSTPQKCETSSVCCDQQHQNMSQGGTDTMGSCNCDVMCCFLSYLSSPSQTASFNGIC